MHFDSFDCGWFIFSLTGVWRLQHSGYFRFHFSLSDVRGKVQKSLNRKQMVLKMACADGIQECLENVRDLQAYNTQEDYMKGLTAKN